MPSRLRSTHDAEDFVMDAIVELLKREDSGALLIVTAKRNMLDAAKSPRSRVTRLMIDVPGKSIEGWQEDMEGIEDIDLRWILEKRLEGYKLKEIVVMTGLTSRMIQRKIAILKKFQK